MITKKLKNYFFNIVIVTLAACFLLLGVYFLQKNEHNVTFSSEIGSLASNKIYASDYYTLTLSVDENYQSFTLNGENIIPGTSNTFSFEAGQAVSYTFRAKSNYNIEPILSYNTDTNEMFTGLTARGFTMPSFNLTIIFTSVEVRNIIVNKFFFDNVNDYHTSSSANTTRLGNDLNLNVNLDLNYQEYELNGKWFYSHNNYNNITYGNGILTVANVQYDDEIDIYFIKKNYVCTIYEEDSDNTSIGGTFDVLSSDDVFNVQKINNRVTCNVFLNAGITITNISANAGYKFVRVYATDRNGHSEGVGFEITNNTEENTITISSISTDLLIYVQFIKTYEVLITANKLHIDDENIKIGKVGFYNETMDYDIEPRLFDSGSSATISTEINDDYSNKYEFKKWNIMTDGGRPLDIEDYGLTEADILLTEITVYNIDRNIKIEAFYGVKNFNVSVVWDGNGTIESVDAIGDSNYVYPVTYGEDITFKFIPKNNMYFVRNTQLIKSKESDNESENAVGQTQKEGYLEYKITNVLQNLQVRVSFAKNTWWEHIETEELQGKGTEKEPYRIYTASDLAFISKNIYYDISPSGADCMDYSNAYYVLMNDIDCGKDYYFMPLGIVLDRLSIFLKNQFNGTFNYQYHNITNMWTELDINNYLYDGLFELLGPNAKIINRYRDYKPLIFGIGGSLVLLAIVIRVVFLVEKKRNKPKKIVTLNNYINNNLEK